jgi:DNA uptake protein ComE-like DNA-binding protein
VPVPGTYNLYIFGLSDAINTTEFLEENDNASLDVAVWNYKTEQFDTLCQREQYGKEDCFLAGQITADNVSPVGDIRLQLISHDVTEDSQSSAVGITQVSQVRSGYAWFNYAVLAPVPVFGRININTASERVLRSLPGLSKQLAANIEAGVDSNGRPVLKPYRRLGDLLQVKGMTLDTFSRFVNLVMLESFTYTVAVEAQSLSASRSPAEESTEANVSAQQSMRYIIELQQNDSGYLGTRVLEQTRL